MSKKSFGVIGVKNTKGELTGIITDGDLRRNINNNLINKKASDIMTRKPKLVSEKTLVGEALNLMNSKKMFLDLLKSQRLFLMEELSMI